MKMKEIYLMDKETGELIPASDAIKSFYKTHGALDDWTKYYEETSLYVEGSTIDLPSFAFCTRFGYDYRED